MTINYKDPKILAQMSLTHMVQSIKAGSVTAKSGLTIDCRDLGARTAIILNETLGSALQNSFFWSDEHSSIIYQGVTPLSIAKLLERMKGNREEIYEAYTGRPANLMSVLEVIKLTDLSKVSNDPEKKDIAI